MKIPALNRISINVCNIAAFQVVTIFVKRSNLRWNHMCATFVTGFLFLLLSRHYSFDKLDIWSKMWSNDYFSSSVGEHLQYTSKKLIKANHVPQIKLWIGLYVVFLPRIILPFRIFSGLYSQMSLHRLLSPPRCHIIIKDCLAIDNICNFKDHMYSLHRLLCSWDSPGGDRNHRQQLRVGEVGTIDYRGVGVHVVFVDICGDLWWWFWDKVWCSPTAGLPRSTCLPSRRSASPGCRPTRSGGSRPSPSSSSPPSSPSSPTSGSWSSWWSAAR